MAKPQDISVVYFDVALVLVDSRYVCTDDVLIVAGDEVNRNAASVSSRADGVWLTTNDLYLVNDEE